VSGIKYVLVLYFIKMCMIENQKWRFSVINAECDSEGIRLYWSSVNSSISDCSNKSLVSYLVELMQS